MFSDLKIYAVICIENLEKHRNISMNGNLERAVKWDGRVHPELFAGPLQSNTETNNRTDTHSPVNL